MSQRRPIYLNLFKIRLPVTSWVSILHRVTGVLLFLLLPFWIYLLELSLRDADGFNRAAAIVGGPIGRLPLLLMAWAVIHHLLAGIRVLLVDIDIGIDREGSRRTAWLVNIVALAIALFIAGWSL